MTNDNNLIKKVTMSRPLEHLELDLARDKTWVGRNNKDFDFLGYRMSVNKFDISEKSLNRFADIVGGLMANNSCYRRILLYIKNWFKWCLAGVSLNREALLKNIGLLLKRRYSLILNSNFENKIELY